METTIRILLADANADFGKLLSERFAAERGFELVGIAADGQEALDVLSAFLDFFCVCLV